MQNTKPTKDGNFREHVIHRRNLCAGGNALLAVLSLLALILSVVAYVQGSKKSVEELVQCILIGILVIPLFVSAYLVATLKYNKSAMRRLLLAGFTMTVYGCMALGFGGVFARRLISEEDWKGEVTSRTASTVVNLISFFVAALVMCIHYPLLSCTPSGTKPPNTSNMSTTATHV